MTSARAGKDLLVKVDFDGDGSFTTLAGLQNRTVSLNGTLVDITNQDSEGNWREAIAGVDVRSMSVSGDGILAPGLSWHNVNQAYFQQAGAGYEFQVIIPGLGKYTGRFVITQVQFTGTQSDVVKVSLSIESSSIVNFQPDVT